ncbi:putative lipoprotein [Mycobacterium kansasii 732]|nr:putative lipoprotein [Mycobacterium kansasii 732]
MQFGGVRGGLAAASLAALVATCTGCGADQPPTTTSRSMVTPTTQIAGAGVLGNARKPDESCARDAAAADPGRRPGRPTTLPA